MFVGLLILVITLGSREADRESAETVTVREATVRRTVEQAAQTVEPTEAVPSEAIVVRERESEKESVPAPRLRPDGDLYEQALAGAFRGSRVELLVPRSGEEERYQEALSGFERRTGIGVDIVTGEGTGGLFAHVAGNDPPDIAAVGVLRYVSQLADQGLLVDVRGSVPEDWLETNYRPSWLRMATMPGPQGEIMAAIWHTYSPRGLVFYPKDDFEAAGYEVPETWDELMALSDRIVEDGGTPWCVGIESGPATGWIVTNWLEDVLLRTAPLEAYDGWISGDLDLQSEPLEDAYAHLAEIWFHEGYVHGGAGAIPDTPYMACAEAMFEDPPNCWLHLQASFMAGFLPDVAVYGQDYDWFPLPSIDEAYGQPQTVWGTLIVMLNDRPEVSAAMAYFARGESARPWLDDGMSLSPHEDALLEWYGTPFQRSMAVGMEQVTAFYPDASDAMPNERGGQPLWQELTAMVSAQAASMEGVAALPRPDTATDDVDPPTDRPPRRRGNIVDLIAEGVIEVETRGSGIDELELDIKDLLEEALDVDIPIGTYFLAGSAGAQNMVVRRGEVVTVNPGEILGLVLDVACANMERDVPRNEDTFSVAREGSPELTQLMIILNESKLPYDVEQGAVWIVTNNANYHDLGTLVSGFTQARVISSEDAARAMQLVHESGIDIRTRRIWLDRGRIAEEAGADFQAWVDSLK